MICMVLDVGEKDVNRLLDVVIFDVAQQVLGTRHSHEEIDPKRSTVKKSTVRSSIVKKSM